MRPLKNSRDREVKDDSKHLINDQIRVPQVMVIGADGEQLGVMITREAIRVAEEQGLDLVEVAPNGKPPVCKILDYGKLKYREQKKAADARKKTAVQAIKELRVRYSTDKHDLETKIKNARKFLEDGDKVRFQMRFKGRESVYRELGEAVFKQIAEQLNDLALIDDFSPLIGQKMSMTLGPRQTGK
ncbi:MAG: translation initiation factor IF-3 [Proteobacteria bacterium]|nr:translation initiation factor IF-3 [Pseudomonadota bacterium]